MAFAQTDHATVADITTLPEETDITGERFTIQLRERIFAAQETMYAIYNELNGDDRFNISCGSILTNRVC